MKMTIPIFETDEAAEDFVDTADLSQFDLSGATMVRFELRPKDKSINLRLPSDLLSAVQRAAELAGVPYQRFIRMALERSVSIKTTL